MAKRGHGEGTITKRADGRWEARISFDGGKRRCLYGKTYKEVQQKLRAAQRAHQDGLPVVPERQTFGQFLDRWLEDSIKPTLRVRTYESYRDLVRLHVKPALGRRRLSELTPQDIQRFLNERHDSGNLRHEGGLSARTVEYLHAVTRRALGQAVEWGLVPRNVAALAKPPRVERQEVAAMAPDQARALLLAIRGHRLEALYTVALVVGMRQGEALGLRWDDVDLDAGIIHVRVQLQRIEGKLQPVEPKTTRSRRTIPLPPFAVAALREHRIRQLQDRLMAGEDWRGNPWGLVFTSQRGTPLDGKNVTHRFQDFLRRAGFPRMRFHDLRHACASLLLAQHVPPRVVMEILGHSNISMTLDIYSHVTPALQREAAQGMETLLMGTR